jgi:hypothetical protein
LQDLITDDEIISDSYNLKEVDGTVYEADCKKITLGMDNIGALISLAPATYVWILTKMHRYRCQRFSRGR